MSAIYDNWERLVAAVLRKQQLWELFHDHSRSPSILSEASDFSSSFNLSSRTHDLSLDFAYGSFASLRRAPAKLVLISDFSPAFDVKDVYVASAEILGIGTFGSTFKAAMDNGISIVVKRLNKSLGLSEPDFKRHMDIAGNVRHENVVALRACYSSEDERLMLYDYYRQIVEEQSHFDWEARLRTAIGAARGIAAIHAQNGGKLAHGNIKASNIFLNPQQWGCVSDLGLANMTGTTLTPTARCYAPEVKNTRDVSQASDVYSFGILLLELLTRKSPVHFPGGPKAVDLVKLVSSVKSKERAAKVFDAELLTYARIRDQAVEMLQIGMTCVAKSIKKRPKMSEVVQMLADISTMNPGSNHVSVERNLVFLEDANPTFDLEDMLRASAEVLGKGTFGTSYKAILEDGTTVVVKRLKDVTVTFEDFQQHMKVIGRIRHKNVAELRAYHFSRDDKLLVYDYYNQGTLSTLLHGKKNTGKIPLGWKTRLKIAVGAARGIAHIHRQGGGKLVHGNIKSSNIFLDGQKYSIVSDAGLAKVTNPIRRSAMRFTGYCAPEVMDTRKVSQASDVYSFGVLLLELVSGRPPQWTTDDFEVILLVNWIQTLLHNEWTPEVIDLVLLKYENEEEAMVQVLQIALDCVTIVPEHRPRMTEVVKLLEEISGIEPSDESRLEDRLEQPNIESRLEDLLEDLLPTLTP
ncbi:UNVERIFIED_CONTAM: putative inactive receptor kinase [Sesamum indicum]